MAHELDQRGYNPIVPDSPYAKKDRYYNVKEEQKFILASIKSKVDVSKPVRVLDAGCGNAEFLFYIKNTFPHWKLRGIDLYGEFIETAKSFEGLAGVDLETKSIFEETGTYDLVLCNGTVQIFRDISQILGKLLDLTAPGGWLFADGLFNKYPIEVRLEYQDNSSPHSRGLWRVDWTQHSRDKIRELFGKSVSRLEFEDIIMDLDLPRDPNAPANRTWTFRDAQGRNLQTNGCNIIKNKTLLIAQK